MKIAQLLKLLQKVWIYSQQNVSTKWNRTLPFGDYIVDRWHKAKTLGFGDGTSIYDSALVFGKVEVGKKTWIGPCVLLDGTGGLSIGDNCSISNGVQIYSHDSVNWALTGGKSGYEYKATSIGDNCYLGPNVVVSKGVSIGDGCLIGANSLVTSNIPPHSKAYGTPCKVVDIL